MPYGRGHKDMNDSGSVYAVRQCHMATAAKRSFPLACPGASVGAGRYVQKSTNIETFIGVSQNAFDANAHLDTCGRSKFPEALQAPGASGTTGPSHGADQALAIVCLSQMREDSIC